MRRSTAFVAVLAALATCKAPAPQAPTVAVREPAPTSTVVPARPVAPANEPMRFSATAYAVEGITKSGTRARRGIVAADPKVLPLGSRIRVSGAGKYSGNYLVEDTGPAVKGRIIDIKVGSVAEAMRFGRQPVQVEVLRSGYEDAEASAE